MPTKRPRSRPSQSAREAPGRRLLVAVVVDPAVWFDREIVAGAAQFAREAGDWQLYIEEESANRLPDLRSWRGDGIIASFTDRRVARAIVARSRPLRMISMIDRTPSGTAEPSPSFSRSVGQNFS